MKLKSIFKKTPVTKPEVKEAASKVKPEVPEGLLKRCNKCGKGIFTEDYKKNLYICPKCGGYLRMPAQKRIAFLTEKDSFEEWDTGLTTENPLHMIGYPDRIKSLQEKTKLDEAVITGKARIGANEVALMVMDGRFLMASMGEVVGEKIARGVERATKEKLPVIIFTCSGGARMQEGMTSLMQMAKTSAALKRWLTLHYSSHRSDNRRRYRKFCYAWRYHFSRAKGTHRICRPASYRADHSQEAAERIPAFRISLKTRFY